MAQSTWEAGSHSAGLKISYFLAAQNFINVFAD